MGGYNYFPDAGKGVNGIKGRIELRPVKAFTLNLELKKDNYNPTEFFVEGIFTVPLDTMNVFKITNPLQYLKDYLGYKKGIRPLRERMVDRVVRDIDVTSQETGGQTTQTTEKLHDVTYVDNSNAGAEDGTLENPYATIQDGVDNIVGDGWVYVKEGSGDYAAVTLTDDVTLWGSGYDGGYSGLSVSGVYPVIDGVATGVTLADNNTVMGFEITGNTTAAVYSTAASTANINHNIITANTGDGIRLFPAAGDLTATITDNTLTGNTGYAVNLVSVSGTTMTTTMSGNTLPETRVGFASNSVTTADLGTGLIWASDGAEAGCNDGLADLDFDAAAAWASALDFGGYSDWRMPTIAELEGILDHTRSDPAINTDAFPHTVSDYYWSSTTYADNPDDAWVVYFSNGDAYNDGKEYANCVRAVRGS